jgi:hypothetical protein
VSSPNRSFKCAPDGTWVEYAYDGLDRMVWRQDASGAVLFFHQGMSAQIALEYSTAAAKVTTRYLVDAFDVPRGKLDIGNLTGRSYYITDLRGNVPAGAVTDHAIKAVSPTTPTARTSCPPGP